MAWIESHESLPSHPKTKRMCRILKISRALAVGHLHFFWWWAMNHAQDGILDRYDAADIADACEWEGDAHELFNALTQSGFIDQTETGYVIHDWYDYAGKLIDLRKKDAERKRNGRGKHTDSNGHPADIQRTSNGSLPESIRNPNPNPNQDLDIKITDENLYQERLRKLANELNFKKLGVFGLETIYSYIGQADIEVIEQAMKRAEGKHVNYFVDIINGYIEEGKTTKESIEPKGGNKHGTNRGNSESPYAGIDFGF